jgi:hypothetical protein
MAKLGYNKQLLPQSCPQQLNLLRDFIVVDYDTTCGKVLRVFKVVYARNFSHSLTSEYLTEYITSDP